MKKKILSALFVLCVLAGAMPGTSGKTFVQAEKYETVSAVKSSVQNLEYVELEDGTIEIDKYTEEAGVTEVIIPEEINGKKVTVIGYGAFMNCSSLTNIVLPNGITTIGEFAFYNCAGLTSIKIPEGVTTIEAHAFNCCTSLADIDIARSVTSIGNNAFGNTLWQENRQKENPLVIVNGMLLNGYSIESHGKTVVEIPDGVTSILNGAFTGCTGLTSIKIPDSVTSIGYEVFYGCTSLTSIDIPSSVTSIGRYAFYNTPWLENKRKENSLVIINGIVIDGKGQSGKGDVSVKIPDGVTSIGEAAFNECTNLVNIELPNSISSIGLFAFDGCTALKKIEFPGDVTYIGGYAFRGCTSLTWMKLPKGLTSIEAGTMKGCTNLNSIEIPDSVTKVYYQAFEDCKNLQHVYYTGSKEQWNQIYIVNNNEELKAATIHYNTVLPEITDVQNTTPMTSTAVSLAKVKLAKNRLVYNGKALTPAVTVTDKNGQAVNASDYKVTYENNKKVGQATVTVTGTGKYTGTLKATFKILPKGTSLSKVTAKKKGFTAKWKKQAAQTTGYQLQYSLNRKFKSAKNVQIKKSKIISSTVKKLKVKKKYFVRIRTYKNVKINGKSQTLYSGWSKVVPVVTKK